MAQPLTTARQVRSLPPEEASKQIPVEIHGTVVLVDAAIKSALIQDDTAGTYFRSSDVSSLRPGDQIIARGVSVAGMYLAGFEKASFEVLGHGPIPAGLPASYSDLMSGRFHYQQVSVEGIVRSVTFDPEEARTILQLAMDRQVLEVRVQALPETDRQWVDARVKLEGIAAGTINPMRQLVRPVLWMQDWKRLQILEAAPALDQIPKIVSSRLLAFNSKDQNGHRVRVTGVVTATFPNGEVFLRDEHSNLHLKLLSPEALQVGDQIDATGFPQMERFSATLDSSVILNRQSGPAPAPTASKLDQLWNGALDQDLVSITAKVSGCFRAQDRRVIFLQERGKTIQVISPLLDQDPPHGAQVRITGICQVESSGMEQGGVKSLPRNVILRCRTPDDVSLLHAPTWWTAQRLAVTVGALLILMAVAALWITFLKRQVKRQTAMLRGRIEHEATLEERQRIAREFHDTLEQGLTGLALRLGAVKSRAMDEKSDALLMSSRDLVSQIQEETRSLVSELRRPPDEGKDSLIHALQCLVAEQPSDCGPAFSLQVDTDLPPLPPHTVHHLKMMAREAVTNALKHAEADHIQIHLKKRDDAMELSISDDGKGFAPHSTQADESEHYGCVGIEERCEKIGASVCWHSAQGIGTSVVITTACASLEQVMTPPPRS